MNEESNNQPTPPVPPPPPISQNSQPTITPAQQYPVSASQLGLTQPKDNFFDFNLKKLIVPAAITVVLLGSLLTALVLTNVVGLTEFKTINYDNAKGQHYKLKFYSRYSSDTTQSGTKQLIAKSSTSGKFPLNFLISSGDIKGYDRLRDCVGFSKAFDVQNDKLNQKISVCNAIDGTVGGRSTKGTVYIAGFTHDNKVHIITISQDYGSADLTSQSDAQETLKKFGLEVYQSDIEKIVSSINVK
jgi:hypothetical protein